MISLNGIAVPHHTLDSKRWVDRFLPTLEAIPFDPGRGRESLSHLMLPPKMPAPPQRIGVLHWPIHACRFATFHTLLSEDQLSSVDPGYPGTESYGSGLSSTDILGNLRTWTLVMDDSNAGCSITTDMHPLAPMPIADIDSLTKLYLVTLVDIRYFWWRRYGSITIDSGAYPTTWEDLFDQLSVILDETFSIETIDAAFLKPSELMKSDNLPAPLILDAAAWAIGRRVVRKLDGTILIQTASAAKTQHDSNFSAIPGKLSGGQAAQSHLVWDVPERLAISFNKKWSSSFLSGQHNEVVDLDTLGIAEYADVGGRPGTMPVFAQIIAEFSNSSGTGDPTNKTDLTGYAEALATEIYKWGVRRPDVSFPGVVDFIPNGFADAIEWSHYSDPLYFHPIENSGGHRVHTRVLPSPWNWRENGRPFAVSASGGDAGFWALLTDKVYPLDGGFIEYSFVQVVDVSDPTPILWTESGDLGVLAYEVNNIDLPTSETAGPDPYADDSPTIVWMRQGSGDYYLFDSQPRWELVEKTGDLEVIGGKNYYPGVLLRYDQVTKTFEAVESVYLIDANAEA